MLRSGCLIGTLWLVTMALSLVAQGAQFTTTISFVPAELPELVAVYGASIEQDDVDGIIGPEWDDAQTYEMKLGKYWAEILLKHDGEYLYIAMIVKTLRYFPDGFEGYVVFESGDGRDYSRGDDIISVFAEEGLLFEVDYHYVGQYEFWLDTDVGGQNNAYGAGNYDNENRWYVFEFVKELVSQDTKDVSLDPGDEVPTIYGWASY